MTTYYYRITYTTFSLKIKMKSQENNNKINEFKTDIIWISIYYKL